MNAYNDSRETVEKFVETKGLRQTMLLGGAQVARTLYAVTGFPTTFLLDAEGRVSDRTVGFASSQAAGEEAKIKALLDRTTPAPVAGSRRDDASY